MQPSTAIGGDAGIPVSEDITDEEAEVTLASEGKETASKWTKLKVPQKQVNIISLLFFFFIYFCLRLHRLDPQILLY